MFHDDSTVLFIVMFAAGDSTPGGLTDVLLQEDGFALLNEDGTNLVLE